jgi:uncharacterized protein YecA (UPF0149 family)
LYLTQPNPKVSTPAIENRRAKWKIKSIEDDEVVLSAKILEHKSAFPNDVFATVPIALLETLEEELQSFVLNNEAAQEVLSKHKQAVMQRLKDEMSCCPRQAIQSNL